MSIEQFLKLETRIWEAFKNGDSADDAACLSENFLGVYPSGTANKDEHVAQLIAGPLVAAYELSDAQLLILSDTIVLLSYTALWTKPDGSCKKYYISSIWQSENGSWLNVFSQDTLATKS